MRLTPRLMLTVLLVLFGTIPTIGTVLLIVSTKNQEAHLALDSHVAEISQTVDFELKSDLERFRQILLTSAQNPAYTQLMLDPAQEETWKRELNRSLLNLTTIFPGMIDEACRIDAVGVEVGRVVQGAVSTDATLSLDESANPFFKPTQALATGSVHYQTPYISPDSHRWVISVSTPFYVDGKSYGILHFEVPLVYYYHALKSVLPHDGFLALVGPDGQIFLNSGDAEPNDQPFPLLSTLSQDAGLKAALPDITGGKTGFAEWNIGNTTYRMRYHSVAFAPGLNMRLLVGLPAVPGFMAQFSPFAVPLGLGVLMLLMLAILMATLQVQPQYGVEPIDTSAAMPATGKSASAGAERRRHMPAWLVLTIALTLGGAAAFSIDKLHENVNNSHQAELSLVRMEGLAEWLNALHPKTPQEITPERDQQTQAIRDQLAKAMDELGRADEQGTISQRAGAALRQYEADFDQLSRLYATGRVIEAGTWEKDRLSQSYATLLGVSADSRSVYSEASVRANTMSNVGSAIALILAALLMSFLFWRFEQVRRASDLVAERALRRSEQRFRSLVQNSSDVITIIGADNTIHYQSTSSLRVFGYESADLAGTALTDLIHSEDTPRILDALKEVMEQSGATSLVACRLRHNNGEWRHVEIMLNNLLQDSNVLGIVLNTRDVSERQALEDELAYRAFHDSLTNLANRALFMDRLEHAMARPVRHTDSVAVLFLDLDGFKRVNDTLGHKMGDRLLVEVGTRLKSCLRPADTVARLGGDEFTILIEDVADLAEAARAAERITEKLRAPFAFDGQEVFISSSIGIALGTASQDHPDMVLTNADAAMYEAKQTGKARYVVFDAGTNIKVWERFHLEKDLRQAIERGEFRVHYQPVLDLNTNKICEMEALVRWEHPERGMIFPGDFIPLAEDTGLIVPIGQWVLEEACKQMKKWHGQFPSDPPLMVNVNLSARQIMHTTLVHDVNRALKRSHLDPHHLTLEITESLALDNGKETLSTLQALNSAGIHLALDDFGMGYSALSYLKRFPVDTLKLDHTFINGLGKDPEDTAIVHAVIKVAHALNLKVTAEGIEVVEQLEQLRALNCDRGQGYYFAKPMPSESMSQLLALEHKSDPKAKQSAPRQLTARKIATKLAPAQSI